MECHHIMLCHSEAEHVQKFIASLQTKVIKELVKENDHLQINKHENLIRQVDSYIVDSAANSAEYAEGINKDVGYELNTISEDDCQTIITSVLKDFLLNSIAADEF